MFVKVIGVGVVVGGVFLGVIGGFVVFVIVVVFVLFGIGIVLFVFVVLVVFGIFFGVGGGGLVGWWVREWWRGVDEFSFIEVGDGYKVM